MAVLNVTPDSFTDGGDYLEVSAAVERGLEMAEQGADIIDIGGESTRPGAPAVPSDVELERVIPVIDGLRRHTSIPLSIDTSKAPVARAALAAGVNFVNDISGLCFDEDMATVVAAAGAGLFLMHTRGCPEQMQKNTDYQDLLAEVVAFLQVAINTARAAGVAAECLAVDPGIGFAKNAMGNLALLKSLSTLHQLGCPILLGTSRKSFIGQILHQDDPRQRLYGTLATVALGVAQGVQLFRVHDVRPAREAALVAWAIREQKLPLVT
jgi:dihydropteroate synthase